MVSNPVNILIAEDEVRIAAFIEKGLRQHGFKTAIADNGQRALELAEQDEFDLLLLDLGLPLIDGWTVLAQLRDRGRAIPVIVVTACDEWRLNLPSLGIDRQDVIFKPFRFQTLLMRIRYHLDVTK